MNDPHRLHHRDARLRAYTRTHACVMRAMRSIVCAVGFLTALLVTSGARAQETPEALPEGPGRDETFHACIASSAVS